MINKELQFPNWISKTNRKNRLLKNGYSSEEAKKIHLLVDYRKVGLCETCGFNPSILKKNKRLFKGKFEESEEEEENEENEGNNKFIQLIY